MMYPVDGRTPRATEYQSLPAWPPGERFWRVAREGNRAWVWAFGVNPARGMDRPRRYPGAHLAPALPERVRDDEDRARGGLDNPGKHALWGAIAEA